MRKHQIRLAHGQPIVAATKWSSAVKDKEDASSDSAADQPGADAASKGDAPREKRAIDDKNTALIREGFATAREGLARLREDVAALRDDDAHVNESMPTREAKATARKRAAASREKVRAASSAHITTLQQANANLVVASMEATKLTEQVQAAKALLDHLAHHDILTGLPNRIALQDRLNKAIELAHRQGHQLAVLFADLDQFKHINDSLGHAVGDKLLRSVAQRLITCIASLDTLSRQCGDQFVLLLAHIDRPEDAALLAQKIQASLAQPHRIDRHEIHVCISIGISIYPDDGQDPETLIWSADTAMYHAKESGRNKYKFFEQSMNAQAVQRQSIEASLRRALQRQEFVLYYQPKINLRSGAIVGVEALVRLQHPQRGLLLPEQFVAIAEDCGLILPIGRWVLREACRQAQAWRQAGLPPITVAINASALEFHAEDFIENVRVTLAETGLDPRFLELELTEGILMRDAESSDSVLHALADLGVKLAIDDFGTGYSSLSYLRYFPIDSLKIDQSFVNRMTNNPDDATIVSAVIGMGKSLRQRVIAEGVETPEQCAFLVAQHCDEGQGYYFGRPVVAEELTALLKTALIHTLAHKLVEDSHALSAQPIL